MVTVLLLCAIFCACAVLTWCARKASAHPLPPAMSGGFPIIGHTPKVAAAISDTWSLLNVMSKDCMEKGGIISAQIGTELYYLITDPDDALTAANTCIKKHFIYNYLKPWLGEGLITSSGDLWQRHRKLLNPAFAVPVIHSFLDVFNQMSKQLLIEVEPHVGKGPFDHCSHLRLIAFQTFCRTAFGISDANVNEFAGKYMESADQIMNLVVLRFLNVWLHSDLIFKLSGLKKKEENLLKTLDEMAYQVIGSKKEAMKNLVSQECTSELIPADTRYKSLMNLLMELENDILSEKEIKEEVDTAIIAGFDTTSNTLTCLMVLLGSYPEVQQHMYEEMIEVLGKDKDVEKDDIKRLVYTEAVIKEALRVFPITPVLLRHVDKDVKLKNYTMRAGSHVVLLPLGTHRDPLWGKDVEEFRPERWLDPAVSSVGNRAFFGFSVGKRSCIGKTYAMISMKVTLSQFIRRYRLKADINKVQFNLDMVLKPVSSTISIEQRN